MSFSLKLSHKALILITVPLISEAAILATLAVALNKAELEANKQIRSKAVITDVDQILITHLEGAMNLFLYNRSHSASSEQRFQLGLVKGDALLQDLKRLTANNQDETPSVLEIESNAQEAKKIGNDVFSQILNKETKFERGQGLTELQLNMFVLVNHLKRGVKFIEKYEEAELARSAGLESQWRSILLYGFLANLGVAIALALVFMRTTAKRIAVIMDNTMRLSREAPLLPPLSGSDELKQIDLVFHQMAEALSEAARKERAVIENAVDVICSVDDKLTFYRASPASTSVFGYEPDELSGMRLVQLILPEDFEKTRNEFERVKKEKQKPFFENRVKRKDGSVADLRWSVHWSTVERAFYCVASDITARREVERLKQEFISMMSHDLRTPLMSIQASLALLSAGASGQLQPAAARNVQDAERNISYIISLINSLIDVERIETAKLQIYVSEAVLSDVLQTAVQAVRGLAVNKGIDLVLAACDLELEIDSDRIVQVLINLISNALKFSPRNSKISIYSTLVSDEVEICVSDQGRGIPESDLSLVFDRFKQVNESDAREQKGSGLGLAICKAIVEAHGGTIGVRSRLNEGTTFWFRLPLWRRTVSGAGKVAQWKA